MSRYTAFGLSGLVALLFADAVPAADAVPETGTFRVEPNGDEKAGVAEQYRLPPTALDYTLTLRHNLRHSGVKVYDLTFPSPVQSDIPENNTVHCEYFVPAGEGPFPAVVVLDILQGNAMVARAQAMWMAQHGVAGMVVHMAHYGPRRPPGGTARLLSTDIPRTLEAVRQTVLDIRCAFAWMGSRPEVDADNLGVVGTSLGSLVGAVAAANEPRVKNVCLLLGGGGLVDAYYDHPLARQYRPIVELFGGRPVMKALIAPVDPLTYAAQLKSKNLLMICASRDDIVPPSAGTALWEACGKQKIIWVDSTHVGAGLHVLPALQAMTEHVRGK
jgi:cephalosporin-C deacetylase-like acetyl esterase